MLYCLIELSKYAYGTHHHCMEVLPKYLIEITTTTSFSVMGWRSANHTLSLGSSAGRSTTFISFLRLSSPALGSSHLLFGFHYSSQGK